MRASVYEDGRSAKHMSVIDYEVEKTSERKVDTPDLIKKSGEGTKEHKPSQDGNSKENVTLELTEVIGGTEDKEYATRKQECLPAFCRTCTKF